MSLLGVDDGEDAGDRLSEVVAADRIPTLAPMLLVHSHAFSSGSGTKCDCFGGSCGMCVCVCAPCGLRVSAHILFSLVPEEAIFWMRSWPSSVFSSPRVLKRSSLFLDHSWPALILLEDCDIVSDPSEEEQSSTAVGWWWGSIELQEKHSHSSIAAQSFAEIRDRSRNAPFSQVMSI